MILCQTDYEEGLMKEGYAPQVRWPQHDTFACGERAERGPERRHAVRHQKHYLPLQPLSLIMYIRNAHYGALLYRIAIETCCELGRGFCKSLWAKWRWSWILLWLFWNNPSPLPLRPVASWRQSTQRPDNSHTYTRIKPCKKKIKCKHSLRPLSTDSCFTLRLRTIMKKKKGKQSLSDEKL